MERTTSFTGNLSDWNIFCTHKVSAARGTVMKGKRAFSCRDFTGAGALWETVPESDLNGDFGIFHRFFWSFNKFKGMTALPAWQRTSCHNNWDQLSAGVDYSAGASAARLAGNRRVVVNAFQQPPYHRGRLKDLNFSLNLKKKRENGVQR